MHVDWDWEGAGRELRSAVALDPHDPDVRWQYAFYLGTIGRFDESVQETRESLRLDPNSPFAHFQLGFALRVARQYGAAVDAMSRAVALAPDTPFFRAQRGFTRALNGECDLALADLAAAGPSQFDGYVAARCGARDRARRLAAAAPRDDDVSGTYMRPWGISTRRLPAWKSNLRSATSLLPRSPPHLGRRICSPIHDSTSCFDEWDIHASRLPGQFSRSSPGPRIQTNRSSS